MIYGFQELLTKAHEVLQEAFAQLCGVLPSFRGCSPQHPEVSSACLSHNRFLRLNAPALPALGNPHQFFRIWLKHHLPKGPG